MKNKTHIAVIALFMAALWFPLLYTPRMCQRERAALTDAENRDPGGTLSFSQCGHSIRKWVGAVQHWFQDSFAFRSRLMCGYSAVNFFVRNYPGEFFGKDGVLFKSLVAENMLSPLTAKKHRIMNRNLEYFYSVCSGKGIPCRIIVIPAKITVHPDLAPRWLRLRCDGRRRTELTGLIREFGIPVLDLSDGLKTYAAETGELLYFKYEYHWNLIGALYGYREMMTFLQPDCPGSRIVTNDSFSIIRNKSMRGHIRHLYLDYFLNEPIFKIDRINLPPVKILEKGRESYASIREVYRNELVETFCLDAGSRTVLFIRDSFLNTPSPLLNHSFGHVVYCNFSNEGRDVNEVIERYQPDLLVVALQESYFENFLLQMKRPRGEAGRKWGRNEQ